MSPAGAGSRAEHKVTPVPVFPGLSGFNPKSPGQTRIVVILEAFPQGQESPREKRRGSWRGREKEGPTRQTINRDMAELWDQDNTLVQNQGPRSWAGLAFTEGQAMAFGQYAMWVFECLAFPVDPEGGPGSLT